MIGLKIYLDNRLLKYYTDDIKVLNPIDFVKRMEGDVYDK